MTRSRPEKRPKRSKGAEVNDWRPRRWSHGHGRRGDRQILDAAKSRMRRADKDVLTRYPRDRPRIQRGLVAGSVRG
jgi:hypothetical protein